MQRQSGQSRSSRYHPHIDGNQPACTGIKPLRTLLQGLARHFRRKPAVGPGVQMLAGDPLAMAQLLILFRVVLCDGLIRQPALNVFERLSRERFAIGAEDFEEMHALLDSPHGRATEMATMDLLKMLDADAKRWLIGAMIRIAGSESHLSTEAQRLIATTAELFGINPEHEGYLP